MRHAPQLRFAPDHHIWFPHLAHWGEMLWVGFPPPTKRVEEEEARASVHVSVAASGVVRVVYPQEDDEWVMYVCLRQRHEAATVVWTTTLVLCLVRSITLWTHPRRVMTIATRNKEKPPQPLEAFRVPRVPRRPVCCPAARLPGCPGCWTRTQKQQFSECALFCASSR